MWALPHTGTGHNLRARLKEHIHKNANSKHLAVSENMLSTKHWLTLIDKN